MKFTYCLSSVIFFMYFSVVVLVTVNGQPTTDDDIDKYEIAKLKEELATWLRGELRQVIRDSRRKGKLAAALNFAL